MLKQNSGAIVNLASIGDLNGFSYTSTYSATKHAVVGLTNVLYVLFNHLNPYESFDG